MRPVALIAALALGILSWAAAAAGSRASLISYRMGETHLAPAPGGGHLAETVRRVPSIVRTFLREALGGPSLR